MSTVTAIHARPLSPTPSIASTTFSTASALKRSIGWPRRLDDFPNNLGPEFAQLKAKIVEECGAEALRKSWIEVCDRLNDHVVPRLKALGTDAIPTISFQDLVNISPEQRQTIRDAGCVVVRGLFPQDLAKSWEQMTRDYIAENKDLVKGIPRNAERKSVWDIYWSPAQLAARGHDNMLKAQVALNKLWTDKDPDDEEPLNLNQPYSYADRARLREPGDANFALGPHIDSGSLERWEDNQYRSAYKDVFEGRFEAFQDYDIRARLTANQDLYGGTAASAVLRTWQGWTSLSNTGPGEGSLSLYPSINEAIAYVLLRPFFSPPMRNGRLADGWEDPRTWKLDTTTSSFPGSIGGKSQELGNISHPHLRLNEALVSLPRVQPGDAAFWHCDGIHAVDPVHRGQETASVFYIGAVPACRMNDAYMARQYEHFRLGYAPPDFRSEDDDGEARFKGFVGVESLLTDAARRAMAVPPGDAVAA